MVSRFRAVCVAGLIAALVAGCDASGSSSSSSSSGTSSSSSSTHEKAHPVSTVAVTTFWRRQVSAKYDGPVATGDGRGCAQAAKRRWVCTAHIENSDWDVDVYGTVSDLNGAMIARLGLNRGSEITHWFTLTGGGCQTNSCADTHLKP